MGIPLYYKDGTGSTLKVAYYPMSLRDVSNKCNRKKSFSRERNLGKQWNEQNKGLVNYFLSSFQKECLLQLYLLSYDCIFERGALLHKLFKVFFTRGGSEDLLNEEGRRRNIFNQDSTQ